MPRAIPALVVLALAAFTRPDAARAGGDPDPGFGVGGMASTALDLGGFKDDLGQLLTADALGRLYMVGMSDLDDSDDCLGITRWSAAGVQDTGYGVGGIQCHDVLPAGFELFPTDATVLPDGGLLVAGVDETSGHPAVCAFTDDGEADVDGFGADTTPGCLRIDTVAIVSTLSNGSADILPFVQLALVNDRVHLAMQAWQGDRVRVRLSRTTFDGALVPYDQHASVPLFADTDTTPAYWLSDMIADGHGRLLLTGAYATPVDYHSDIYVARVHADTGARDDSFADGGVRRIGIDHDGSDDDVPAAIALLPRGRILVAGAAGTTSGLRPAAVVLTAHGDLAANFHGGTPAVYDPCVFHFGPCRVMVTGASALSNNRLLLSGYSIRNDQHHAFTLRLSASGVSDPGYGSGFPGQFGFAFVGTSGALRARVLHMQADAPVIGGWMDGGGPSARNFFVARLQP